jgi:hypothetical protein
MNDTQRQSLIRQAQSLSPAPRPLRKTRSDKGLVMATARDLKILAWIADQYAVQFYQVQALLSRFPGAPLQSDVISEAVVKDQISRWQRAGWCEYKRFLAEGRGFAWMTRKGLQLLDLENYHAAPPAATRLSHLYAVNQVRLLLDREYPWISEREIRSKLTLKKGESPVPIPDGYILYKVTLRIAIEVEISQKKPAELQRKLQALVSYLPFDEAVGNYRHFYSAVWFYVPDERIKRAVEAARDQLHQDWQKRITVAVKDSLLLAS